MLWGKRDENGVIWVIVESRRGWVDTGQQECQCVLFLGEYEHTMDVKKRLAIPAELRDVLDPKVHGEALIVVPGANGLLWLWPERTFDRIAESFGAAFIPSPERARFEQRIFSKASRLPIDASGRVRLPERLTSEFSLGSTVVILGVGHHMELCDVDSWRRRQTDANEPSMDQIWETARRATETAAARNSGEHG